MPPKIWVDTDIALGAPRGDVDDGFALAAVALAAREGAAVLAGVSVVSGNTEGNTAFEAARRLLESLGASCPLVSEADAPQALAGLPPGTSILAIGPPTNLVRAAGRAPSFPSRVDVRVVGRVRNRFRHPLLPLFDLNLRAAGLFWSLPFRRRLVFPLDVVRRLRFGPRDLARVAACGLLGGYLARHSDRWLARAPFRYLSRSFPVWDLVPALDAVSRLPGAVFDPERSELAGFDAEGARRAFFALLDR